MTSNLSINPKLQRPSTFVIAGPSGSGKTIFTRDLILNEDWIFEGNSFKKIFWCSPSKASVPSEILNDSRTSYLSDVPDRDLLQNAKKESIIIVLDDFGGAAGKNEDVSDVFMRFSHHNNVTMVVITQNLFQKSKHFRDITLNCNYLVYFNNLRDRSQIYHLARQLNPEISRELVRLYIEECGPHGYLFFDLCQRTHPLLRYRTDIFKKNYTTVFLHKSLIKAHLIEDETTEKTSALTTRPQKIF